jgi:hypothetical protein
MAFLYFRGAEGATVSKHVATTMPAEVTLFSTIPMVSHCQRLMAGRQQSPRVAPIRRSIEGTESLTMRKATASNQS